MLARLLFTHSRYLSLIILTTIVVGYSSFNTLGRQEDPTITPFIAKIETLFPGASPSRVESLVTKPLEEALQEIPELEEIKSTSASGISVIAIETDYRLSLSEIDRVWTEIRDVVASEAERFPEGVMPPVVDDDLITAFVKIMAISSAEGRNLPPLCSDARRSFLPIRFERFHEPSGSCFSACRKKKFVLSWTPENSPSSV